MIKKKELGGEGQVVGGAQGGMSTYSQFKELSVCRTSKNQCNFRLH